MTFDYSAILEAEIDDNFVIEAVVRRYKPEEVFPKDELEKWAEEEGYVKQEDIDD